MQVIWKRVQGCVQPAAANQLGTDGYWGYANESTDDSGVEGCELRRYEAFHSSRSVPR